MSIQVRLNSESGIMATTASSSSTVYENITDTQSMTNHLSGLKFEDSDTFDVNSCNSFEKLCEPLSSSKLPLNEENEHIYTNVREMDEMNGRQHPPVPDVTDIPKRNLNNGWMEFETEAGRTFFYNFESGKSQWIPPRFLRTPAQIQAMFKASKSEIDENDSSTIFTCYPEEIHGDRSEVLCKGRELSEELCSNSVYENILESDNIIVEPILKNHGQQIYENTPQSSSHIKHIGNDHMVTFYIDVMIVDSLESSKIHAI
uniref:WW domain-containing protein n=1 Tax=Heterorhabditis bacteriophora TaxID=37862 RepID=A0A1I7XL69_HETBA